MAAALSHLRHAHIDHLRSLCPWVIEALLAGWSWAMLTQQGGHQHSKQVKCKHVLHSKGAASAASEVSANHGAKT